MDLGFSRQIFGKIVKDLKNSSSEKRVVPCEQTEGETDRQIDITKLIIEISNFAKGSSKVLENGEQACVCG
jgi:hypothetical protein